MERKQRLAEATFHQAAAATAADWSNYSLKTETTPANASPLLAVMAETTMERRWWRCDWS